MRSFLVIFIILAFAAGGAALHTPLPLAQYILALDLYSQGRFNESVKEFNNLISEHPEQVRHIGNSLYWQGLAFFAMKKYKQAEKNFSRVIGDFKESDFCVQARYQLGRTRYARGQYPAAMKVFTDFYKTFTRSSLRDNSLFWRGVCHYKSRDNKRALNDFYEVLKKFPLGNKADASRYMITLIKGGKGRPEVIIQKVTVPAENNLGDLAELLKTKEEALKEKEAAIMTKEEALKAKEEIINQAQDKLNVK